MEMGGGGKRIRRRACQPRPGLSTEHVWIVSRACRSLFLAVLAGMFPCWAMAQFNGSFAIERFELDDENFLDWKAYQLPRRWHYESYTAPNRFQSSVGSISLSRFYFFHQIDLEADLGPYLSFLYHQDEEAFFRSDSIYQEVELRAGSDVYGSILGWVEGDKRFDNIGFAASYGKRTDWNYLRLSRVNQFQLYNQKNAEGEKEALHYDETPVVVRFEARAIWQDRLFIQADLRRDQPARFSDQGNGVKNGFEGRRGELTIEWWAEGRQWLAGATASLDEEKRRQSLLSTEGTVPELSQSLLLRWWDCYGSLQTVDSGVLTFGYLDALFENRISSPDSASRFTTELTTQLVYATWESHPSDWVHGLYGVYAGDAESITRKGDSGTRKGNEDRTQVKASAGLVLQEQGRYRFLFNSTWDLDLIEERAWDGGNVQVQLFF